MDLSSLVVLTPLAGGLLVAGFHRKPAWARYAAYGAAWSELALCLFILRRVEPEGLRHGLAESFAWLPAWGISIAWDVDGMSALLVLLTATMTLLALALVRTDATPPGWGVQLLLLLLESALMGLFLAADAALFFGLWSMVLLLSWLLAEFCGVERGRVGAGWVISFASSVPMLGAVVWLNLLHLQQSGAASFDRAQWHLLVLSPQDQKFLLPLFVIAFVGPAPVLARLFSRASIAASLLLTAVVLKAGSYGLFRFATLFPLASREMRPVLMAAMGALAIVSAVVAWRQREFGGFLAWASSCHVAVALLGIVSLQAEAVQGGAYHLVAHGVFYAALVWAMSFREDKNGGTARGMFAAGLAVAGGGWAAVPGSGGFPGIYPVLEEAAKAGPVVLATMAVVWLLLAVRLLGWLRRTDSALPSQGSFSSARRVILVALIASTVFMGVKADSFLSLLKAPLADYVSRFPE